MNKVFLKTHRRRVLVLLIALFALAFLAISGRCMVIDYVKSSAVILGAMVIGLLIRSRLIKRRCRKTFAQTPALHGPESMDISDQGLTHAGPGCRGESTWDVYTSYIESQHLFLIFLAPNQARVIPKRALASEEELQALRSLLATHVGVIFPKRRNPNQKVGL